MCHPERRGISPLSGEMERSRTFAGRGCDISQRVAKWRTAASKSANIRQRRMCSGICTGHLNVCLSFELIFLALLSVCFIPTACCSIITSAVQACHKSFADPFLGRAMHSLVGFAPFHSAARCCEISTPQNFDCACKADVYASCFNKSAALPAPLRMTQR